MTTALEKDRIAARVRHWLERNPGPRALAFVDGNYYCITQRDWQARLNNNRAQPDDLVAIYQSGVSHRDIVDDITEHETRK